MGRLGHRTSRALARGIVLGLFAASGAFAPAARADFTATPNPVKVGQSFQLYYSDGNDYYNSGYDIQIIDEQRQVQIGRCQAIYCTANSYASWVDNVDPAPLRYRARIISHTAGNDATGGGGVTLDVPVRVVRFKISLTMQYYSGIGWLATSKSTPGVTNGTGLSARIRNELGQQLQSCASGPDCNKWVGSPSAVQATIEDANGHVYARSCWWRLKNGGYSSQCVSDLDLYSLATLFSSTQAICDQVLLAPGSNTEKSSVTDQWYACDAAREAGGSRVDVLFAVAAAGGGVGAMTVWVISIWQSQQNAGIDPHSPAQPGASPPPPSGASPPPPVPHPLPPALGSGDVAAGISATNDLSALTDTQIDTVAEECIARLGLAGVAANPATGEASDPAQLCQKLPIWISGFEYPDATWHDLHALNPSNSDGHPDKWTLLNYKSAQTKDAAGLDRSWYYNATSVASIGASANCLGPRPGGASCDEYPFFATEQGYDSAPAASLLMIDSSQNSGQGGRYGNFVTSCKMREAGYVRNGTTLDHGDPFIGLPIPPPLGIPTFTRLCNGKSD